MAHETLAVVRLPSQTGLPADTVEMQFAFLNADENGGGGGSARTAIENFLTSSYGGIGAMSSFLAGSLKHDANAVEIDVYDISGVLGGGHRGSPIASGFTTLATPSVDTDLPLQACVGLSFHGDLSAVGEYGAVDPTLPTPEQAQDYGAPATHSGVTRPRSRRRGRIMFGPLCEAAMGSDSIRIREPDADFVTCATAALAALTAAPAGWCVWSRRDATLYGVTGGWIADETDVVRRRRLKATRRTLWVG